MSDVSAASVIHPLVVTDHRPTITNRQLHKYGFMLHGVKRGQGNRVVIASILRPRTHKGSTSPAVGDAPAVSVNPDLVVTALQGNYQ